MLLKQLLEVLIKMEINLNPEKPEKCSLCGKHKGQHKAKTYNCPFNEVKRGFPSYRTNKFFTSKENK